MSPKEQRAFVTKLINRVRDDLLDRADKWPAGWDDHELRELVADVFDCERATAMVAAQQNGHLRYRNYRSELDKLHLIPESRGH